MFRRGNNDAGLDHDIQAHLDLLAAEHERRGLSPQAAREAARRDFGGVEQMKERYRDQHGWRWADDLVRDVRYALRSLRRAPGFAAVAVVTLGLGIGANTAIFSVVNALLLRPLPYANAEGLVGVIMTLPADASPTGAPLRTSPGFTIAEVEQIKASTRTLTHAGTAGPQLVGLSGHEEGARLQGARISASALQMLGVQPVVGRLFTSEDERPGSQALVLIAYPAWQRFFGGDASVVGTSLTFDTVLGPRRQSQYTVAGVLPEGFEYPGPGNDFWMTVTPPTAGEPGWRGPLLARLAAGVTPDAATAELEPIIRQVRQSERGNDVARYEIVRLQDEMVVEIRPALRVLMGAVACLLLIACLNVANLLLARTAMREREIAVRTALGAGRVRVVRLLTTESAVLALGGALVGIVLAVGGVRLFRMLATTDPRFDLGIGRDFPRLSEVSIDGTVLAFAVATAVAVGILLGLFTALRLVLRGPAAGLQAGLRSTTAGFFSHGVRSVLLVVEIAAAVVLLVGGALVMRSFANLLAVDPGYSQSNVLTFQVALPLNRYPDDRLKVFAEDLVERLRVIPGVDRAAYANQLPMVQLRDTAGGLWRTPDATRQPAPGGPDARLVSRDYLQTMGIRVVAGRTFEDRDGEGQPRVLVINEATSRRDFAGEAPLGQLVYIGRDTTPWQIVGVVDDVRQFGLDEAPEPQLFIDLRQWPATRGILFPVGAYYAIRTTGDPMQVLAPLRERVREMDPGAALFNIAPMDRIVQTTVVEPRMYAVLLGLFAAVGVALAVIGIYGLMTYVVANGTRDFGIRMALGAQRGQVLRLVLGRSLVLALAGVSIGLVAAAMLTQGLERLLFGVTPLDATTFAAMAVLFIGVAAAAAFVPARRATLIDPFEALRAE